jgi:hypothetical protein
MQEAPGAIWVLGLKMTCNLMNEHVEACLSSFQMHNGPLCSEPMYLTNKNMVRKIKK